jgi:hypothetical protein
MGGGGGVGVGLGFDGLEHPLTARAVVASPTASGAVSRNGLPQRVFCAARGLPP